MNQAYTSEPPAYGGPNDQTKSAQQNPRQLAEYYTGQPSQYPGQPAGQYPLQPAGQDPSQPQMQVTVVSQGLPPGNPSPSYIGFAIFVCLCCCLPIGICAIICAQRTNDANAQGNWGAAKSASKTALGFSIASFVFGPIGMIALIALAATGNLPAMYHYNYFG